MRPARVVSRIACAVGESTQTHGMVTAELAMVLPALVLVVSMLMTVVGAASDLAKASDAARSAARAASIGASHDEVVTAASRLAPQGTEITIRNDEDWVNVVVAVPPLHWGPVEIPLPSVTGSAAVEPDLAGADR
jgi:hypothetical protein